MNCGIIGLPNVGKTLLFNLLTSNNAPSSNYPYCTVEPNTGVAIVKDSRMHKLAELIPGAKVTYPHIKFVDVAGLPPGASKGEGLGNQFLSNIRNADSLLHVVRAFSSAEVSRLDKDPSSPQRDIELVETELYLADIDIVEKRIKENPSSDYWKEAMEKLVKEVPPEIDEEGVLLTPKSRIVVINITTGMGKSEIKGGRAIYIDVAFQQELTGMSEEEREYFTSEMPDWESSAETIFEDVKKMLDMITFITIVGGKEIKGYNIKKGLSAYDAAGKIHTDIQKGFIRAKVYNYKDFKENDFNIDILKKSGKFRIEGRDYEVQDGDIIEVMFN